MHFARLIVCILTAWLETSQGPMCHCVRLIPVVGLRSVLLLFLSVFLPLLFRTLPVLFPALHLQCRHRRGLKPLHSRRMRNVAPWRYIILPHPDSSLTDLLTDLATIFDRRQLHNVPLLHPARAVHEVDTGEYRILESVNYVVETCTHTGRPGELFEVRFSLRAQQLQQRFPQVIHSLLSCVFSVVLDSGTLCIASNHVRDRPYSLNTMPSPIGSSAWFFSCVLWVFLLRARARWGYSCAGSVRLSRFTSSCTVHAFVSGSPLLVCVEHAASVAFHFPFSDERQMLLRKIQWDDKTQAQWDFIIVSPTRTLWRRIKLGPTLGVTQTGTQYQRHQTLQHSKRDLSNGVWAWKKWWGKSVWDFKRVREWSSRFVFWEST